jgi:hypothetical protein
MGREGDIMLEKHSLNKLKNTYPNSLPSVRLIATFKDTFNLYFLTDILDS